MVRLAVMMNDLDAAALSPGPGWPEMHATYPEVLEKLRATQAQQYDEK